MIKNNFKISAKLIAKIKKPLYSKWFMDELNKNSEYSWGYNHPGVEASAFLLGVLGDSKKANDWLEMDEEMTGIFSNKINPFTVDIVTDNSRIYDIVRYLDFLE